MMIFHLIPSYCKSPQVSRTLLSILLCLRNSVIWIVSVRSLILLFHFLWVFLCSSLWWSFTEASVRSSLLRFPGFLLVFLQILTILLYVVISIFPLFSISSNLFYSLWGAFQTHQLWIVWPLPSYSIVYLVLHQNPSFCLLELICYG